MPSPDDPQDRWQSARRQDLAASAGRELERARLQGRRDAETDMFKADTQRHFKVINGSIADTATRLDAIDDRLSGIETQMATASAVHDAIATVAAHSGAQRFTRLQATGIGVVSLTATGAFVLSIIAAVHG